MPLDTKSGKSLQQKVKYDLHSARFGVHTSIMQSRTPLRCEVVYIGAKEQQQTHNVGIASRTGIGKSRVAELVRVVDGYFVLQQ